MEPLAGVLIGGYVISFVKGFPSGLSFTCLYIVVIPLSAMPLT